MLVQKKGLTKTTKNLLITLGIILLLGGGYFGYNYFATNSSSNTENNLLAGSGNSAITQTVKTNLDTEIFNDPQFQKLDREVFSGFVDQAEGISLSDSNPVAITDVSVSNPKTGSTLIIFWKLPEFINFDRVVVYRSVSTSQSAEKITSVDVNESDASKTGSLIDENLTNNKKYNYFVIPKMGEENEQEDILSTGNILQSGLQVSGTPTDETPPSGPTNVQINSNEDGVIYVNWVNPDDQDLDKINIYRSSKKGELGNNIKTISSDQFTEYMQEGKYMQYEDEKVSTNTLYYYVVTSEDGSGNESSTDVLAAPNKSYLYNPFQPINF